MGFAVSIFDPRLYFLVRDSNSIILLFVVDDMCFSSNSETLLSDVKSKLFSKILLSEVHQLLFIGHKRRPTLIRVQDSQTIWTLKFNSICTPLPSDPQKNLQQQRTKRHYDYHTTTFIGLWSSPFCTWPSALFLILHSPYPCSQETYMRHSIFT